MRQRVTGPTQPASVGAGEQRGESPTRVRGSMARRVCPRVVTGCRSRRATPRPTRSAARWQRTRERGSSSNGPERVRSSQRSSTAGFAVATPRSRYRPEPGARKGVAGRRLSRDRRHLGSSSKANSFTRPPRRRSWRPSRRHARARARCAPRGRRQRRQRHGTHTSLREDNARGDAPPGDVRPAEANRTDVRQAISPACAGAHPHDAPGTNEARVLVRRREKAEVGPTHPVSWHSAIGDGTSPAQPEPGQNVNERGARTLAEEASARRADARSGDSEARTVREPRVALRTEGERRSAAPGKPWADRDTTEGVSIVACSRNARSGASGDLGCAGERFDAHRKTCVEPASRRSWNRRGGARVGDERRQRSATFTVKAAPADEARAVRHARRRKALALQVLDRASCESRKRRHDRVSLERVDRSWPVRKARPPCHVPKPRERFGPGRGHSRRTERCAARVMCTRRTRCRVGPHARS